MTRVLIVDDEKSIRRTLGEFLREARYEVAEAEDAEAALAQLRETAFDVVVSDIVLPRVNGVELLLQIHSMAPDVQVVMMTGEPTVETATEALRLGAVDYLFKPITKAAVLRATDNAARIKYLEDTRRRLEAENQVHRENLERLVAERTEQLRKLARAVEQSPVAIVITDRAGNIEFVNPKFCSITGYAAAEVLGQNPRLLKSGETTAVEYRKLWETILAGREWRGEFHNKRKDGSLFWETTSISAVRDSNGQITHFIAVSEDMTERKQLEARFLRAQRVESIGSLASGIAHDLNNILTPILMCAPMLRFGDTSERRQELAQTIEASARRAVGVVKQLLSFGRGQDGRKQPIQIRHLVREMVKITGETFPRSIQIRESCPADLWLVPADATQMQQVLLNLLINARDAMPQGGTLTLQLQNVVLDEHFVTMRKDVVPGPYVRLRVEDTGTGIPEEVRGRIFESFFTTKEPGYGTGLGLTTVLGIVKEHQGFISFTSEVGRGTAFEVHLPAVPMAEATPEDAKSDEEIPRGRGELVLVVDDEPVICESTRLTLEHQGYRTLRAHHGIEALAQFSQHAGEVRAVITDCMMPQMDGVMLCRTLRALSPATPLIVSSGGLFGRDGADALAAFKELGLRHILHKPHNADALLRALAAELQTGTDAENPASRPTAETPASPSAPASPGGAG